MSVVVLNVGNMFARGREGADRELKRIIQYADRGTVCVREGGEAVQMCESWCASVVLLVVYAHIAKSLLMTVLM